VNEAVQAASRIGKSASIKLRPRVASSSIIRPFRRSALRQVRSWQQAMPGSKHGRERNGRCRVGRAYRAMIAAAL
jgi:hypothetical protein